MPYPIDQNQRPTSHNHNALHLYTLRIPVPATHTRQCTTTLTVSLEFALWQNRTHCKGDRSSSRATQRSPSQSLALPWNQMKIFVQQLRIRILWTPSSHIHRSIRDGHVGLISRRLVSRGDNARHPSFSHHIELRKPRGALVWLTSVRPDCQ